MKSIAHPKMDKREGSQVGSISSAPLKGNTKSVTILISALNEEAGIGNTYYKAKSALTELNIDHQIILINDGSRDRTREIMDSIQKRDLQVQVIHHQTPRGIGFGYKIGIRNSTKEYFMFLPGDDSFEEESIRTVLEQRGKADIVIPYHINQEVRTARRKALSRCYTALLNLCFGLRIKYFNGIVLHKTRLLKNLTIKSNKFTYQSEIIIKLVKIQKCNLFHVGISVSERSSGESTALKLSNFIDVGKFFILLCYEIHGSSFARDENFPMTVKEEV